LYAGSLSVSDKSNQAKGGIKTDIKGKVYVLPMEESDIKDFNSYRNADGKDWPKYCIILDDYTAKKSFFHKKISVSVAITFSAHYEDMFGYFANKGQLHRLEKSWSFCTFTPDLYDKNLKRGAKWLSAYTRRYSAAPEPRIFTDFDEWYDYFPADIEFPLQKIGAKNVDTELLAKYAHFYGFQLNLTEIVLGDKFENIYNSTIFNRSSLAKAISGNRVVDDSALDRVRFVLDLIFHDGPASRRDFLDALRRKQLAASPVFDAKGEVGGLSFVDLDSKTVYAGSELGKGYDAATISSRLGFDAFPAPAKGKGRQRSVEVPEAEKVVEARLVQKKGRSLHL
jgi:hypothetical protein